MKTRILKKINERIRIIEEDHLFFVESRNKNTTGFDEWKRLNQFNTFKRALEKKNSFIVMVILRDLGYRMEFVKRRTKRNK